MGIRLTLRPNLAALPLLDADQNSLTGRDTGGSPIGGPFYVGDWRALRIYAGCTGFSFRVFVDWYWRIEDVAGRGFVANNETSVFTEVIDVAGGNDTGLPSVATAAPAFGVYYLRVKAPYCVIRQTGPSVAAVPLTGGRLRVEATNQNPGAGTSEFNAAALVPGAANQPPPVVNNGQPVGNGLLLAVDNFAPAGNVSVVLPPYSGRAHLHLVTTTANTSNFSVYLLNYKLAILGRLFFAVLSNAQPGGIYQDLWIPRGLCQVTFAPGVGAAFYGTITAEQEAA